MQEGVSDLSAAELRRIVLRLPEYLPITEAYEASDRSERARRKVTYRSQREHVERWLGEYDGPGFYNRQKPGQGAEHFYNHFQSVAGLIWLAEGLGLSQSVLQEGVRVVRVASRNPASECAAFRRLVPWSMMLLLIARKRSTTGLSNLVHRGLRRLSADRGERPSTASHLDVDVTFDVRSDTPRGKDHDQRSATLRRYHRLLWSKPLPSGHRFELVDTRPRTYLYHRSDLGEFVLSSDTGIRTFCSVRRADRVIAKIPVPTLEAFSRAAYTIGSMMIFPANRIGGGQTINQHRGIHPRIVDRFDLTLECIRRHYDGCDGPLTETIARYSDFFALFGDFRGYVEFFLLQDLVTDDFVAVRFMSPFDDFAGSPIPASTEAYLAYRTAAMDFLQARNQRVAAYCRGGLSGNRGAP